MESKYDDLKAADCEVLRNQFASFMNSDAFKYWSYVCEEQAKGRIADVLAPSKPDLVLEQEYKKGEIQGLQLAVGMITLLFDAVSQKFNETQEENPNA